LINVKTPAMMVNPMETDSRRNEIRGLQLMSKTKKSYIKDKFYELYNDTTSQDRLMIRTFIICIILIPITALAIYLIYGYWGDVAILDPFPSWAWIRFSVEMAVLTCLWTYTLGFYHVTLKRYEDTFSYSPFSYSLFFGMCIVPFNMLLVYPDKKVLGTYIDNLANEFFYLLFVLEIIHGFGFHFVQRGIQKYLRELNLTSDER